MIALKSVPTNRTTETSETFRLMDNLFFSNLALGTVKIGS